MTSAAQSPDHDAALDDLDPGDDADEVRGGAIAFPDVSKRPSAPGPVPIPYPNTT